MHLASQVTVLLRNEICLDINNGKLKTSMKISFHFSSVNPGLTVCTNTIRYYCCVKLF